ncbi:MAG: hypothetical protein HYY06_27135 [Deltaproteobacteria bacterium]|nr:hypothetical protein [Deltaproteobacteria bacterium]
MRDMREIDARAAVARRLGEVPVRDMVPSQRHALRAIATHRRRVAVVAWVEDDRDVGRAVDSAVAAVAAADANLRIAAQCGLPVVAMELCVSKGQAFAARIAGADAVLVPACLSPTELGAIVSGATSAHMLPIVEVQNEVELGMALELRPRAVLLRDRRLASTLRPGTTLLLEAAEAMAAREARGIADAIIARPVLVRDPSFQSLVSELG